THPYRSGYLRAWQYFLVRPRTFTGSGLSFYCQELFSLIILVTRAQRADALKRAWCCSGKGGRKGRETALEVSLLSGFSASGNGGRLVRQRTSLNAFPLSDRSNLFHHFVPHLFISAHH